MELTREQSLEMENNLLKMALSKKITGFTSTSVAVVEMAYNILGTNVDSFQHSFLRWYPNQTVRRNYFNSLGKEELARRDEEYSVSKFTSTKYEEGNIVRVPY